MMLPWPPALKPSSGGYAPNIRNLSGGQSLSGFEQVQQQMSDRWMAGFTFPLGTDARVLAARALLTQLRGRAVTVGLPDFDVVRRPLSADTPGAPLGATVTDPPFWRHWPDQAGTVFEFTPLDIVGTARIEAVDRIRFTSGGVPPQAGHYVTIASVRRRIVLVSAAGPDAILSFEPALVPGAASAGTVFAYVNGGAAINATQIEVAFVVGGPPLAGHRFSIGNRMYGISAVMSAGVNRYTLEIWPWLRSDVMNGTLANFAAPLCEMRLASDQEGADALRALEFLKHGNLTLRFDEAA